MSYLLSTYYALGFVLSLLCALPHLILRTSLRGMCFECLHSIDWGNRCSERLNTTQAHSGGECRGQDAGPAGIPTEPVLLAMMI